MRNSLLSNLLAAVVLAAGTAYAITAGNAGELHNSVVSAVPATYTPHIQPDDTIHRPMAYAVTQAGNTMYVGGKFALVADARRTTTYPRTHLFAFDATTGAVNEAFAPVLNNQVFAVLAVGNSIYIGGEFGNVNGTVRRAIAKLDATTGALDKKFNAKLSGRVTEIRLHNGRLIIGGTFPKRLMAIDPATGADTGYIDVGIEGTLPLTTSRAEVYRFAISPDGTKLVGVGNFLTVSGQTRNRAFMLDLGETAASLNPWYYQPLTRKCASNTPTRQPYLDDVDFSPDGSYFVFAATGFVVNNPFEIGTMVCDGAARFETNIPNPTRPTWINYTGGDTVHSVTVTGGAVYVQGHFRWLNNPFGRDSAGLGALERRGIGALNPVTGQALDWNPSAPAAQGGQEIWATPAGVWFMSDNIRWGGKYHRGIAYAPLPIAP